MNPHNATRHGRRVRLEIILAIGVATLSTIASYQAMTMFGFDVLGMSVALAATLCGVFELALVTVAVLAREAARDNRPAGVLLALTWTLSSISGIFAAWHELLAPGPTAQILGAAAFRFLVPLLAALMWHLALIGDRHLASGISWSRARQNMRMYAFYGAVEATLRAEDSGKGIRAARRRLNRRRDRVRAVVPPESMAEVAAAIEAANRAEVSMIEAARVGHDAINVALSAKPHSPRATERNTTPASNGNSNGTPRNRTIELNGTPLAATETETAVTNVRPLPVAVVNATATETATVRLPAGNATRTVEAPQSNETETAPVKVPTTPNATEQNETAATTRKCEECGDPLPAGKRATAKYCDQQVKACRLNAFKRRKAQQAGRQDFTAVPAFA